MTELLTCFADIERSQGKAGLVAKTRYSQRTDLKGRSKSVGCQGLASIDLLPLRLKKSRKDRGRSWARNGDIEQQNHSYSQGFCVMHEVHMCVCACVLMCLCALVAFLIAETKHPTKAI